jgi:predicted dehydrogenase
MAEKRRVSAGGKKHQQITRRRFITGAGATALSFTIVKPKLVRGTAANSKIKLGMIGCGGRGKWIGNLFAEHGGYEIVAAAEYFQDRVDAFGEKLNVDPAHRYTGLMGYQRLLDQKVDAVAIESPPYFHPEQAAAAVDAGCHVYVAKPIAVDVPGCHTIAKSGRKASARKRCFIVDFQTRANEFYLEAIKRVHEGALGRLAFGEASYHTGGTWGGHEKYLKDDPANPENRLRAWGLDRTLSGDIITEQNIHAIDVASWIMNEPPLYAVGTGGRKVRTIRTCWDHFAVLFQYSNNVGITFSSRQFNAHGSKPDGIRNRMFGSKGVLETEYGGTVIVRGENFYRGGTTNDIFKQGAVNNIATFYKSITEGRFDNPTVEPSVRSNLATILGRTAAYTGERVYWNKLIKSTEKAKANLRGLKA